MKKQNKFNSSFPITKMHGIGNDFVVYEDFEQRTTAEDVRKICDRHFGIGADGVITVVTSRIPGVLYRMKYFNADGTLGEMCGNGIRCFAKYLLDNRLVKQKGKIPVDTDAGLIIPEILENTPEEALVKVNMGQPIFYDPQQVSLSPNKKGLVNFVFKNMKGIYIGMGNPHVIFFVEKGQAKEFAGKYGSQIENMTKIFTEKTNVEFVEITNKRNLTMHVWERGCGVTLACGTGACATFVAAVLQGLVDDNAKIHLPGGTLEISWGGNDSPVFMTGSAVNSFQIKDLQSIITTKKTLR